MATLVDTGFEAADLASEFSSTTDTESKLSLVTSGVFRGSKAFHSPATGTAVAYGSYTVAGLPLTAAFRFAMKVASLASVNSLILNCQNGSKTMGVRVASANKVQAFVGSTGVSTATTLVAGTWYIVKGYVDFTTNPPKCHVRFYDSAGVALDAEITNDAVAGAVTGIQSIRIGNVSASALQDITFDSLLVTDNWADHPLAMPANDPVASSSPLGQRHGIAFNAHKGLWLPTD